MPTPRDWRTRLVAQWRREQWTTADYIVVAATWTGFVVVLVTFVQMVRSGG